MQLYVVMCEIGSKKIVKRIYKSRAECQHYLADIRKEIQNARPGTYQILHYGDDELLLEERDERNFGEVIQRNYHIVSGDAEDVLAFLAGLIDESDSIL